MRVVFLNQTFHPDVAATAQHAFDLAQDLAAHGHEVHAIASRSLYGERGATLPAEEVVDGIQVHRVGQSLFGKAGLAARILDFVSFYVAAGRRLRAIPRPDVVVCLTTPPFIARTALRLRSRTGAKVVLWSMDLYPDLPIACGMMSRWHPAAIAGRFLDRRCLRGADAIVALGRCMRDRLVAKGADPAKVEVIGVWSDEQEIRPGSREGNAFREAWAVGDRMLVMYSGNFGLGHDVETFLDAAEALRDDDRVRFAFVGGGKRKSEVERRVQERGLANCVLAPYQPRERLGELVGAGDVHLVSLRRGVEGIMVPSKFYGVLAASKPAIYIGSREGEIARTIEEERCGSVIEPGDAAGLAEILRRYAENPQRRADEGERGRRSLVERHSRRVRCEAWRTLLESMANDSEPRA
ncbi:MAG: glycosyltransferase family 4 protein [Phycisphaerales bacterium]